MTTAIVEHVGRGDFVPALVYGAILITLAFVVNGVLASVQHRGASWART
jgi:tungstate transport system permease protein